MSSSSAIQTTCFLHSTTQEVLCGPQHLLVNTLNRDDDPNAELIPLPCKNVVAVDDRARYEEDWRHWLESKLASIIYARDAEPEPAHSIVRRAGGKKGPSSSGSSNAAGRVAVSGLLVWAVIGLAVGAAVY